MKNIIKFSVFIFNFSLIFQFLSSFGQMPRGITVPSIPEFQSVHFAPDEPWPDTITQAEKYYNMVLSWRDFFGPSTPKIFVIESIPDSVDYRWFKPRPYYDEDDGGEPFEVIGEKDIIKQYNHFSRSKVKWKNFINRTHAYWKNYFKEYLRSKYYGLTTQDIDDICNKIPFYYYEISAKDYKKNRVRDKYDLLKYKLYNRMHYFANTINYKLDSLLFSCAYSSYNYKELPTTLRKYLDDLLELEKRRLIINNDSSSYKLVLPIRLSVDAKSEKGRSLWFGVAEDTISFSTDLLRAVVTIALNNSTLNTEFNYNIDMFNQDYFSYYDRFIFYDYAFKKRNSGTDDFNYVNRNINNLANIDLFNASFFKKFGETFSFIFQHELAHVYLQEPANELKCDCNALIALDESIELPGGYNSQGMKSGVPGLNYGIVSTLLKGCIDSNRPELWGVDNTEDLKIRFKFLNDHKFTLPDKKDCNLISP